MSNLLPIDQINAVDVFTSGGLDSLLGRIRAEVSNVIADVSTDAGRKFVASQAYKVARSKTAIDDAGKELVAGWKKQSAVVDAERKRARDTLDALRDEVRKPLTEWEESEKAKEAALLAEVQAKRLAEEAARIAELERREAELREREEAM